MLFTFCEVFRNDFYDGLHSADFYNRKIA